MDEVRFDHLTRVLVGSTIRRRTLAGLLSGVLVGLLPKADSKAEPKAD